MLLIASSCIETRTLLRLALRPDWMPLPSSRRLSRDPSQCFFVGSRWRRRVGEARPESVLNVLPSQCSTVAEVERTPNKHKHAVSRALSAGAYSIVPAQPKRAPPAHPFAPSFCLLATTHLDELSRFSHNQLMASRLWAPGQLAGWLPRPPWYDHLGRATSREVRVGRWASVHGRLPPGSPSSSSPHLVQCCRALPIPHRIICSSFGLLSPVVIRPMSTASRFFFSLPLPAVSRTLPFPPCGPC